MDEIIAENNGLREDYAELSNSKEEALVELTAVKECYASVLVEFNEFKMTSEKSLSHLKADLEGSLSEAKQNLVLAEHKYSMTIDTLRQLTESLRAGELRELIHAEERERGEIATDYFLNLTPLLYLRLTEAVARGTRTEASIKALSEALSKTQDELNVTSHHLQAALEENTRLRENLSAEENRVNQFSTELESTQHRLQSVETDKQTLSQDNDWLKDQVEAMRRELGELDEILNANLNEIREENEKYTVDNEVLRRKINCFVEKEEEYKTKQLLQEKHVQDLEAELAAQERTLAITEADLLEAKQSLENQEALVKQMSVKLELAEEEARKASAARESISAKFRSAQEQLKNQETKLNLIVSDKRREMDAMRLKVNEHIERTELLERQNTNEVRRREEVENTIAAMKDVHNKMRSAMEEMRERCSKDARTIKELVSERDDLLKDRDIIVEKYNKLHDAFCTLRREAGSRSSDDFKKLFDLSSSQESELQKLRHQNEILKKSVSMFVTTVQQKPENLFVERLNLKEGPLRHPKKRSLQQPNE
ncbi:BRCT domain-containing protein [Strigomonas culicis]|uniref:BRCT domain-containing protein n=1 Tax=Strigomonas culicis TaxID=28005 RepID=S9V856_9TRYP|nr:BRCT domain-containing protein [Strigomonas culicis]|eukprot:EPY19115.1 BRCT domain-containing protein [Strigomonas culicis]